MTGRLPFAAHQLIVSFSDALAGVIEVDGVLFDTDEALPRLKRRDTGRAATHEGIGSGEALPDEARAIVGHPHKLRDQAPHEAAILARRVVVIAMLVSDAIRRVGHDRVDAAQLWQDVEAVTAIEDRVAACFNDRLS